jgi:hypothetical protein
MDFHDAFSVKKADEGVRVPKKIEADRFTIRLNLTDLPARYRRQF